MRNRQPQQVAQKGSDARRDRTNAEASAELRRTSEEEQRSRWPAFSNLLAIDAVLAQVRELERHRSPAPRAMREPPLTTANVALVAAATKPDSAAPSWFDAPMKSRFTALTRPRSSSGVESWMAVLRMTTLTWSATPTSM